MPVSRFRKINLNFIHPDLVIRAGDVLEDCEKEGTSYYASSGFRTYAEQMKLWTQGRTAPGRKITNAVGGQSAHNFGLAIDFYCLKDGKASWDFKDYDCLGKWAKQHKLHWGANYKDPVHLSLPGYVTATDLKPLDKIYRNTQGSELDKLKEVWKAVDLTLTP